MVGGFFCKRKNRKGLFGKKGYKRWGSLVNRGKVGGSLGKMPISFLSPRRTEREGAFGAGVDPTP